MTAAPEGARWDRRVRRRWERLPLAWRRALVAAAVLKVVTMVGALAFGGLLPGLSPVSVQPVPGGGFRGWLASSAAQQGTGLLGAGLERFDALWYLAIARDGYPTGAIVPGAAAFYPGYPLVVGALGRLLAGGYLLAGVLVSLAATAVGFAGVHRLAEGPDGDRPRHRRAAPCSPWRCSRARSSSSPRTPSRCSWRPRRGRSWRRGSAAGRSRSLAGAVAGLTRNVGVLVALPVAIEAWRAWREGQGPGVDVGAHPRRWSLRAVTVAIAAVAAAPASPARTS